MNENILHTIYLAAAFLTLFFSAEVFYHKFNVRAEYTRKYVHIFTGLITLLFPPLIENHWLVLVLCGSFLIILLSSLKFNLLPSINAIDRKSRGSILYPVIVYSCYIVFKQYNEVIFYYIPISLLTFCDPVAAFIGKGMPMVKYKTFGITKTLSGSLGFFILANMICLSLILSLKESSFNQALITSLIVSMVSTVAEGLTHKGYDNITIPFSALAAMLLLNHYFLLW